MENEMQFDRAEFQSPAAASCGGCKSPLRDNYFQANGTVFCAACAEQLRRFNAGVGSAAGRFGKALLLGSGAAVAGAILYYLVLDFLHINAALVTIFIGFMVGKVVRKASGGRGGWRYQLLAVFLTYCAIALAYVPPLMTALMKPQSELVAAAPGAGARPKADSPAAGGASATDGNAGAEQRAAPADPVAGPAEEQGGEAIRRLPKPLRLAAAVVSLAVMAFILPVANDFPDLLNLLIIGFGLMQAWRLTKGVRIEITGPHALRAGGVETSHAGA